MKIYYISPYCIFRARTNAIGDTRLSEGFAEIGCAVELIFPYYYRKDNLKREEVFKAYGIEHPYKLRMLWTPLWDEAGKYLTGTLLLIFTSLIALFIVLINCRALNRVIVISRNPTLLIPFLILRKLMSKKNRYKVVAWTHEVSTSKKHKWLLQKADAIIGTNTTLVEDLQKKLNIPRKKLTVSLNPITSAQLKCGLNREIARKKLGLHAEEPLVIYTGKVYIGNREIEHIIKAAERLGGYQFLLTGGKRHVVEYLKSHCRTRGISNIIFTGFLNSYADVIYYQFAADVLVSYYTSDVHAVDYNFPNKICEYMLTRNPIVTPDYPATRDVLHSKNAIFVEAENTEALVQGIRKAIEQKEYARELAQRAYEEVQQLTFRKRAQLIVDFLTAIEPDSTSGLESFAEHA